MLFYYGCHFGIGNELNIFKLVVFGDNFVVASRDKFFGLYLSKVIERVGVVKLKVVLDRAVLEDPFQTFEVLIVFFFKV